MKYYSLKDNKILHLPENADEKLLTELLNGYTHGTGRFSCRSDGKPNEITSGSYTKTEPDGFEYVLRIEESGIYIGGKNHQATVRGFLKFLEQIRYRPEDGSFYAPCGTIKERPEIEFRCVHLCVFPETTLAFLKKCVRACAIVKYTHIVLEFWGMLKFDFMKELAWDNAYTKEQIRPIIKEANALGMEVIPMFNHLGHASLSRTMYGKHVVLDQNPALEYLFKNNGWVWDFESEEVYAVLKHIRGELTELCGEGGYFHIGCDEACIRNDHNGVYNRIAAYINRIEGELEQQDRRAVMWGDMLLCERKGYDACLAESQETAQTLLQSLNKNILIADWHYGVTDSSWETAAELNKAGFEVVCCPWENKNNAKAAIDTVNTQGLFGVMQTTWHTLSVGFPTMIYTGISAYDSKAEILNGEKEAFNGYAASITRKTDFANGRYSRAGWSEKQTGAGL